MDPVTSLTELLHDRKTGSFVEIPGTIAGTFGQLTLSTTLPVNKLLQIYEVDLEVQRAIIPQNLAKLMDYISLYLQNNQTVYFPGVILSARGAGEYDEHLRVYRLHAIEKLYVVDGQHRLAAFQRIAETLQSAMARAKDRREYERIDEISEQLSRLYDFPLSVMIYLDIDARQERQLFSDINKLPRKIGGNLAVLRDQRRFYHVLASRLSANLPALKRIGVDIYSERGKAPEFLFSYHLLIELLAALFEGRLKSASRNNGYQYTESEEEGHYNHAAFYFSKLVEFLPPPEKGAPAWSENVQIALALFLHEEAVKTGSFNRYALEHAMRILPHVPWGGIYSGDESVRLPRRSRIMKAYQFVKEFYGERNAFLIRSMEEAN
jgi:DNA sulfur modification protein DndB